MAGQCPNLGCGSIAAELSVAGVGLSLAGRPFDASDNASRALEGWQFVLGEGPCLDALSGEVVDIPDVTRADVEWFSFAQMLRDRAVASVFAFPLSLEDACIGALTLYHSRRGELSAEQRRAASTAARVAASLVGDHVMSDQEAHQGSCGLHLFDLFNRAVGVVIHDLGVGPGEASSRIRLHAYAHDCLVDDVVEELLGGRLHLRLQ